MKHFKKAKKGFTLVELVIVITVIAILAAVSVGAYFSVTESANNNRLEQESKQIHIAIQTVAMSPEDHSSLSRDGLIIKDFLTFENKLEENLGKSVHLADNENDVDDNLPTIYFSLVVYSKLITENKVFKSFEYHNPAVGGKKAVADVVTGEVKVVKAEREDNNDTSTPCGSCGSTTDDKTYAPTDPIGTASDPTVDTTIDPPQEEPAATNIVLSEYSISLGHNSDGYVVYAYIYDQYNNEMDVLGEWVLLGENNVVAYSPTQGTNRLVIWGQSTGTVKFEFVYNNVKSDVLTVNVVVSQEISKTVVIADYADANSWTDATQYKIITIDENITVALTGGGNTGKYYENGENWRIYQNENPIITFAAAEGYVIDSISVEYTINNTGVLTFKGVNIASDESVNIDAAGAIFGVGNTDTATKGQVRITSMTVVYSTTTQQPVEPEEPTITQQTIQFKDNSTDASQEISIETLPSYCLEGSDLIDNITVTKVYKGVTGLKFSSDDGVNGSLTIKFKETLNVKTIVLNAMKYQTDAAKIALNLQNAQTLTSDLADYSFNIYGDVSSITISATKRMYLSYIQINY